MVGFRVSQSNGFFKRYPAYLEKNVQLAVEEGARLIRDTARANAPVETGALRASIHVVTKRYSSFGVSSRAASRRAGFGGRQDLTIGTPAGGAVDMGDSLMGGSVPRPTSPYDAFVFASVGYARFIEYGTMFIAPRFFMTRALIECRPLQRKLVMDAIRDARRLAGGRAQAVFA